MTKSTTSKRDSWLGRAFVVEDDVAVRTLVEECLLGLGWQVKNFIEPRSAEAELEKTGAGFVILDLNWSHLDGVDVVAKWRARFPNLPILVLSGESRVARAMAALRAGANEFLTKPFVSLDLQRAISRIVPSIQKKSLGIDSVIGNSPAIQELKEKIQVLGAHKELSILLLGESGSGKEVIARAIHGVSGLLEPKAIRPFISTHLAAIPESLVESELFGHTRGAFTNAVEDRVGKFELADGGDLFLDEVADIPGSLQTKLLRFLQEREVEPLGSPSRRRVTVRVISATNQPIQDWVKQGRFREDLLYRLSDVVLVVPPLRDRMEDIPLLVDSFLKKHSLPGKEFQISDRALARLATYHWPGNIRQLESTVKRSIIFTKSHLIEDVEIWDPSPLETCPPAYQTQPLHTSLAEVERTLIEEALAAAGGVHESAYQSLGISRASFYRKLRQLKPNSNN